MRGTLLAYTSLFKLQIRTKQGRFTWATLVLALYLLCSILGRFGVALLGLTFNVEDTPFYTPPLFTPAWENGTLQRDNSVQKVLDKDLGSATNGENIGQ